MRTLTNFDVVRPSTLTEAVKLLQQQGRIARPLAGGTDLLVELKNRLTSVDLIVSLMSIPEISGLRKRNGVLSIGATTLVDELATSPLLERDYAVLRQAAQALGSFPIRNLATVGGNLCKASPGGDLAPALLVLEANLLIQNESGIRKIAVGEFFQGPGKTVLRPGEILREIEIPDPVPAFSSYCKLGRIRGVDLAIVGAASSIDLDEKGVCTRAGIALTAVAPIPFRARKAELLLAGKKPSRELLLQAGELAAEECSPISDLRATAAYRLEMVKAMVRRSLQNALEGKAHRL